MLPRSSAALFLKESRSPITPVRIGPRAHWLRSMDGRWGAMRSRMCFANSGRISPPMCCTVIHRESFFDSPQLLSVMLDTGGPTGFSTRRGRRECSCAGAAFVNWRKIAITLKTPVSGSKRVKAWLRQLRISPLRQIKSMVGGREHTFLLQLRVLRSGFLQDGDVGVGVFPERQEIFVGGERPDAGC